jgi:actin-like ATPase involved in cell morphogenesis
VRYGLGVDLGTTSVAAAISHPGRTELVILGDRSVAAPAVVHLSDDGTLITGDAAGRWGLSRPERFGRAVKRQLGDPTPVILGGVPHAVPELMAAMLRDVVRKVSASQGGPPDSVVLTRPANWGPLRRGLFEQVTRIAGLQGAVTVSDPEAAAAHFAATRHPDGGEIVAVYDLGGGTFDAAVLRTRPRGAEFLGSPEGVERLGGIDFDQAILSYVNYRTGGALSELDLQDPQTTLALARLRQDCVLAKEALTTDTESTLPVLLPGRHLEVQLTRSNLEDMLRAPLESTLGALSRALRSARVSPRELRALVMVGGSTRIPLVTRMVSEGLDGAPIVRLDPDHAVALGAAALAARQLSDGPPAPTRAPTVRPPPAGPGAWPPHRPQSHGAPADPEVSPAPVGRPPPGEAPTWQDPAPVQAGPQAWSPGPPPAPPASGPAPSPPPTAPPPAPAEAPGTPRPADEHPGTDGDWHAPSIGRMLVIGMALLALAVVVGLIAYVLISRLQAAAAPDLGESGRPPSAAVAAAAPPAVGIPCGPRLRQGVDGGVPHLATAGCPGQV